MDRRARPRSRPHRRTTTRRRSPTPTASARWRPPTRCAPAARRRGRPTTSPRCRPTRPAGWSRTSPLPGALDALALVVTLDAAAPLPARRPAAPRPRRCPSTTGAAACSSGRWRWRRRSACARRSTRSAPTPRSPRCSPRSPRRVPSSRPGRRTAGGGAPEMTMAEPPGDGRGDGPDGPAHDPDETVFRGPARQTRKSYARLDVAGTERPDVVVVDQPFEVTLGLQPRKDGGLVASSPLGPAGRRDRRARRRAAPRPDVDRGHRQPARAASPSPTCSPTRR